MQLYKNIFLDYTKKDLDFKLQNIEKFSELCFDSVEKIKFYNRSFEPHTEFTRKFKTLNDSIIRYIPDINPNNEVTNELLNSIIYMFENYDYFRKNDVLKRSLNIKEWEDIYKLKTVDKNFIGLFANSIISGSCRFIINDFPLHEFRIAIYLAILRYNRMIFNFNNSILLIRENINLLETEFDVDRTVSEKRLNDLITRCGLKSDDLSFDYETHLFNADSTDLDNIKKSEIYFSMVLNNIKNEILVNNKGTQPFITMVEL